MESFSKKLSRSVKKLLQKFGKTCEKIFNNIEKAFPRSSLFIHEARFIFLCPGKFKYEKYRNSTSKMINPSLLQIKSLNRHYPPYYKAPEGFSTCKAALSSITPDRRGIFTNKAKSGRSKQLQEPVRLDKYSLMRHVGLQRIRI